MRLDLQDIFDKLLEAPPGTKVLMRVPNETSARTTQAWFRTQMEKYLKTTQDSTARGTLFVSRRSVDKGFQITIIKGYPPSEVEFIYPKED